MTPTFLVTTRTGRYVHAAWLPHDGVRTHRQDDTHRQRVIRASVICGRVPTWHVFYLANVLPIDKQPLCPECKRKLHRMADHDLVAATSALEMP